MRFLGHKLRLPFFKNQSDDTTFASPAGWLVRELLGRMAKAGVHVNPLSAMGVSTVYACVNYISKQIATLPMELHRRLPTGGSEPATDDYRYDLVNCEPNTEMSGGQFRRAVQANATLRDSGYALITRDGLGDIVELYPIYPKDLNITRPIINGPLQIYVDGKLTPESSLIGIKGITFNGLTGISSLVDAKDIIGLAIALQDNASTFFGNGSRPGGILTHPSTLSQEAQDRLRKQIEDRLKGPDKAHALLILEEGLKYEAQREANNDSQFLESRTYQDKAIARHFGVPQSKVGIMDDAHYSNVEQENLSAVIDCLAPWGAEWCQELDRKLLTEKERKTMFFRINYTVLTQGDTKTRYDGYGSARQWGWLCVDEIRSREGLPPLPNGKGKIYLQPANMVEAGAPPPPPKPAPFDPSKSEEDQEPPDKSEEAPEPPDKSEEAPEPPTK